MALTYTESGNNTASGSWAVSHPAASTGDLLIFNIGWDDSTTTTGLTPPSGPNGETAVVIEDVRVSSNTSVRGKIVYYVATGSWSASTITFTPSASEQWTAVVVKVPAGEFDATTPIGADNYFESTTTDSTPDLPSLTAGSTDGGGTVVGVMVGDVDDPDGTITGWTERASTDRGAVGIGLWTRDTEATDSESISAATGATFPSARDYVSFIYIVREYQSAPTVALNSPADASSDSDTTPTLDFTGTDGEGNDVRYEVQVNDVSSWADSPVTYYFDASDAGPTDANTVWTSDANAFDGSTSTQATCSTNGSTSSNFLLGEGTNAVDNGGTITQVRARLYSATNGPDGHTHQAAIYTDGLAELLGTPAKTGGGDTLGWSSYVTLSTPSGGWTWAKIQALETKIYVTDGGTGTPGVYRVEVEVAYSPLLDKVSGGSLTTETITSTQSWTAPVGVTSVTVEAWGAGGGGGGCTTGSQGGGGGGGGGYSKSTGISVVPGTSYSVVVGTGGSGGANQANPAGSGTTGGDSTFNTSTVVAKGGVGGTGGAGSPGGGGAGGASGSGTGDTKTSGGTGGTAHTIAGGGGGGSGGDSTGGGTGGNASSTVGGTAGAAGTTNGAAGGAGADFSENGSAGTAPGGGGGGSGNSSGSGTAAAGANGQVKITYTPGDSGFVNPDVGGDTDPFTSGDNIQFTVQAGDALDPDTYYWRVRGIDPSGSNEYGAWSSTRSFTVTAGGGGSFTYTPQRMRRGMGS